MIIFFWGFRGLLYGNIKIKWHPFLWFLIAYACISLINTVFTINFFTSFFGDYGYFMGLLTVLNLLFWAYIVMCEISTPEKIKTLLNLSVAAAFLVAVYGIFQHQNWIVNVFSWSQNPADRVFSTIGHSNHTAAYLAMNVMILLGMVRNARFGWKKILLWLVMMTIIATILLTASRGGIFALFVGFVCWIVYGFSKKHFIKEIAKYLKIILAVVGILFLGAIVFREQIMNSEIVKRTSETIDFVSKGNIPDRVSWWYSSLEMIKDNPVLGHGLSTFRDAYNKYRRTDYKLPDDLQDGITPEAAHMEYLNIMATQGLLGFAIYAAMIAAVFVYAGKFMQNEKDACKRVVLFSLVAACVVFLTQVLFSFTVIATGFLFFTFIGLIFSGNVLPSFKLTGALRVTGALAAILMLGCGLFYSVTTLAAEFHYKQAQVLALKRDYIAAVESYKKAVHMVPYNYEYMQEYADFIFNLGIMMPESAQGDYLYDAINLYDKALLINSNFPSAHANKALAASRLADLNKGSPREFENYKNIALEEMETAVQTGKNNPLYLYKYGKMLLFFDDKAAAAEQFEKVLKLRNPYKDTNELLTQIL